MKKCIRRLGRDCIKIFVVVVTASMITILYIIYEDAGESTDTSLWLQSVEQQLEEQNNNYYNELYDRYSRIHRDLNDYQYITNKRLESLENRVNQIEQNISKGDISINQTQINGDNND